MTDDRVAGPPNDPDGVGPSVTLRFQLTRDEFVQMMRRRLMRRRRGWVFLVLGPAVAAVGVATSNRSDIITGALFLIFWAGFYYGWCPPRTWQASPQLRNPQVLTFSTDGVVLDTLQATSDVRWDYWSEVFQDRDAYVLSTGGRYVFIPIRAFNSAASEAKFQKLAAAVNRTRS